MFVGSSTAGQDRQPTDQDRLVPHGLDRFRRTEECGSADHPSLTEEAIEALGGRRCGLGRHRLGQPGRHPRWSATRPHRSARAGIPIVEHLTDLARLMGRAFRFSAVPVPVRGLGTFPVRAFVLLE